MRDERKRVLPQIRGWIQTNMPGARIVSMHYPKPWDGCELNLVGYYYSSMPMDYWIGVGKQRHQWWKSIGHGLANCEPKNFVCGVHVKGHNSRDMVPLAKFIKSLIDPSWVDESQHLFNAFEDCQDDH